MSWGRNKVCNVEQQKRRLVCGIERGKGESETRETRVQWGLRGLRLGFIF